MRIILWVPAIVVLLLAIPARQSLIAQESDLQCVLSAIDRLESGISNHEECIILDHLFVVDYNDPILQATVSGPVVNTSRSFNIPKTSGSPNFKMSGSPASVQQGDREEAIAWVFGIYEQIASGLSLSAIAPSTNAALNSMLGTFGSVVMPNVSPHSLRSQDAGEAEQGDILQGGEERKKRSGSKPGEISADVEYETFTFVSNDGKSIALRGAFERTTDSGSLGFGLRLAFNQVTFDGNDNKLQTGEGTAFIKVPLGDFIEVGGNVTGTVSRIKTKSAVSPNGFDQNVNSVGYGPFVSLRVGFEAGHMLAGGLMYQIIDPHEKLDPDKENISLLAYGALAVFSVSEKLALSAEVFQMSNLDLEVGDDSFGVVHPQVHFYISDSFGLILGYKTVLGIDDYDSSEFTLGSSVRF